MNAYEFNKRQMQHVKDEKVELQKENLRIIKERIDPAEKAQKEEKATKKKSTSKKGASAPAEPEARTTIKGAILDILRSKRMAPTCKEMLSALKKKGYSTSDVYVRNTVRDLGLKLYVEQSRIWMMQPR
eukprot:UN02278